MIRVEKPKTSAINYWSDTPMGMSRHALLGSNPTMRDPPLLRKWSGPLGTIIYQDRSNNKVHAKTRTATASPTMSPSFTDHLSIIVLQNHRSIDHDYPPTGDIQNPNHPTQKSESPSPKILILKYLIRYLSFTPCQSPFLPLSPNRTTSHDFQLPPKFF